MIWYFVLWGAVILIGILFIMSGYDKASIRCFDIVTPLEKDISKLICSSLSLSK